MESKTLLRTESDCRMQIERMLKYSQTKVIMPALALGVLEARIASGKIVFTDPEVRAAYRNAVKFLKQYLGHDVHIGAKYEDAYGMRMSRYGFFVSAGHLRYKLVPAFADNAA